MLFTSPLISALTASQIHPTIQKRIFDIIFIEGFSVVYKIIAQFVAYGESKASKLKS
jgi:hypothetical protein